MLVNIDQAKDQISKLIAAAELGEKVIITRHDKPMVKISMIEEYSGKTRISGLKGRKFKMNANIDDPVLNTQISGSFNTPRSPHRDGLAATFTTALWFISLADS